MGFFKKEYEVPQSANKFMKLKDGDNLFRILDVAVMGWVDWKEKSDGSGREPVRTKYEGEASQPKPLGKNKVKHFWAFPVFDYTDKKIKILEITQATIHNAIYAYHNDEDFGDPTSYDIKINKTGEKLETKYNVVAKPPKPLDAAIGVLFADNPVNCEAMFENKDPFEKQAGTEIDLSPKVENKAPTVDGAGTEEVDIDDIDFGTPPVE